MRDVTRIVIILVVINVFLTLFQGVFTLSAMENAEELTSLSQSVQEMYEEQGEKDLGNPSNYQTQTSFGSEQEMGNGFWIIISSGIKQWNIPEGGFESDLEENLWTGLIWLRGILVMMTIILAFMVLKNKMTG